MAEPSPSAFGAEAAGRPLLAVRNLARAFGGNPALRGVSFDVALGERVALIGPNGAGKTTCFNCINGQLAPDQGEVWLDGARIDGTAPRAIARRGVGRTFQVAATFASMTVRENVEVALLAAQQRDGRVMGSVDQVRGGADALLAQLGLDRLADAHCAALAYGDAKEVELALALAQRPRLLLMDEPTAGAGAAARAAVMHAVAAFVQDGQGAVLFTEHDMDVVFVHADRVIVLDQGEVIASGTPAAIRADPLVQAAYLGVPGSG